METQIYVRFASSNAITGYASFSTQPTSKGLALASKFSKANAFTEVYQTPINQPFLDFSIIKREDQAF
ncbi:MAG: hypothetical protein S4CHLAM81_09080 [Chlamydiales bacterium]|nr:hypothetical protein [Chlamydiales bacterium]MCH9635687.1 hypothetical protein [Chlamydiales bacterium]